MKKIIPALLLSFIALRSLAQAADLKSDQIAASLGCPQFRDDLFDAVDTILMADQSMPEAAVLNAEFLQMLKSPRFQPLSENSRSQIARQLTDLARELDLQTQADPFEKISRRQLLAEIEVEISDSPRKAERIQKFQTRFSELEQTLAQLKPQLSCHAPLAAQFRPEFPGTLFSFWQVTKNPIVYGALKSFTTAYQSCHVARLEPLNKSTPDVSGIKVVGTHSDGIGKKRIIADLPALLATDPYLRVSHSHSSSCFAIEKDPLIYNYGGKPNPNGDSLNFFERAGTGTSTLGVDCSGFVYTSMAAAGLKIKKSGRLNARGVLAYRATEWQHFDSKGLDCFEHAEFDAQKNLQPGDILASSGHILIIDSIGDDPFGIAQFTQAADCKAENIAPSRFDFTILQSGTTKGGIGINHIRAADYLKEESPMLKALIQHAVHACLAKTQHSTVASQSPDASLIRHSSAASCQDTPLSLAHSDCVSMCSAF